MGDGMSWRAGGYAHDAEHADIEGHAHCEDAEANHVERVRVLADLDRAEQAEAQDHHKESDVVPRPNDEVREVGRVVRITVDVCPVDHAGDDTCRREQLS